MQTDRLWQNNSNRFRFWLLKHALNVLTQSFLHSVKNISMYDLHCMNKMKQMFILYKYGFCLLRSMNRDQNYVERDGRIVMQIYL